jgi:signal transduction histidine kinase
MNLINNGLKFTKKQKRNYNGQLGFFSRKHLIAFKIIDNGIGIAADKLETVFESFAQGSIEINRKYGGTGLD